jgi:transcriptional regulator with XRE-family HTH domain
MATKKNVGEKIKEIRQARMISTEELSLRSNIELVQIELIEENKILPSLAPLIKIARSLGVNFSTFLDETEHIGPVVTLAEEMNKGASFSNKNQKSASHMNFFALASNKAGRHMEPFVIELKPDENTNNYLLSSHEGEEFIYVLEGCVEINYGKEVYRLYVGDSIYYDSIVNHNVHAFDNIRTKILAVIYTPI